MRKTPILTLVPHEHIHHPNKRRENAFSLPPFLLQSQQAAVMNPEEALLRISPVGSLSKLPDL